MISLRNTYQQLNEAPSFIKLNLTKTLLKRGVMKNLKIMLSKKWVFGVLGLFSFSVPAYSMGHGYLGGSIGPSYAKLSNRNPQVSYLSGILITDAYPLDSARSLTAALGLSGGYEFISENYRSAIAVGFSAYFNPNDYHFNGQVIETASGSPSTTLYNYHFKMKSTRAMAEMQLTWRGSYISPFINFGIGSAWNSTSNYSETSVTSSGFTPFPPFHPQTNLNFAYQIGAGLSAVYCQSRFSLGYRYAHLGKTSFDTRGSTYPYPLKIGSLILDDIYFSYTYLF